MMAEEWKLELSYKGVYELQYDDVLVLYWLNCFVLYIQ